MPSAQIYDVISKIDMNFRQTPFPETFVIYQPKYNFQKCFLIPLRSLSEYIGKFVWPEWVAFLDQMIYSDY